MGELLPLFSSLPVATIGPLWTLGSCDQSRPVYAVPFLAAAKLSDHIFRYLPHGVVNLVERNYRLAMLTHMSLNLISGLLTYSLVVSKRPL